MGILLCSDGLNPRTQGPSRHQTGTERPPRAGRGTEHMDAGGLAASPRGTQVTRTSLNIRAEGETSTGPGAADGVPFPAPAPWAPRGQPQPHQGSPVNLTEAPRAAHSSAHLGRAVTVPNPGGGCYGGSGPGSSTVPALQNLGKPLPLRQPGTWSGSWMPGGWLTVLD